MSEFLCVMLLIVVALFVLIGTSYYSCDGYGKATGRPTKFVRGTCYGEIDGVWYSSDEYNKILVPQRNQIELKTQQDSHD